MIASLYILGLLLMAVYHEPIISSFDFVRMPSSDLSCQQLPFNLSMPVDVDFFFQITDLAEHV